MSKIHEYTEKFMNTAGQTVRDIPSVPTLEEMELRLGLEFEELYEKAQAMGLERTFIMKIMVDKLVKNIEAATKSTEWRRELKRKVRAIESAMPKDTGFVNLVEVFDATLDQNVVWSGTNLAFGFKSIMGAGDREVFRSNMSKFDTDRANALKTQAKYEKEGRPTYMENQGELIVTKDASSKKVLKSHKYSKTNLFPILRNAMGDTYRQPSDAYEAPIEDHPAIYKD